MGENMLYLTNYTSDLEPVWRAYIWNPSRTSISVAIEQWSRESVEQSSSKGAVVYCIIDISEQDACVLALKGSLLIKVEGIKENHTSRLFCGVADLADSIAAKQIVDSWS